MTPHEQAVFFVWTDRTCEKNAQGNFVFEKIERNRIKCPKDKAYPGNINL
jgi:hypothetical protein